MGETQEKTAPQYATGDDYQKALKKALEDFPRLLMETKKTLALIVHNVENADSTLKKDDEDFKALYKSFNKGLSDKLAALPKVKAANWKKETTAIQEVIETYHGAVMKLKDRHRFADTVRDLGQTLDAIGKKMVLLAKDQNDKTSLNAVTKGNWSQSKDKVEEIFKKAKADDAEAVKDLKKKLPAVIQAVAKYPKPEVLKACQIVADAAPAQRKAVANKVDPVAKSLLEHAREVDVLIAGVSTVSFGSVRAPFTDASTAIYRPILRLANMSS